MFLIEIELHHFPSFPTSTPSQIPSLETLPIPHTLKLAASFFFAYNIYVYIHMHAHTHKYNPLSLFFIDCVYMVWGLTTALDINKASPLREANSLSPSDQ